MPRDQNGFSRAEWCVLARIAERPTHGWAISREFEPDTEIGQIWTADRQRIYRALRTLERNRLIEESPLGLEEQGQASRGARRVIFRTTDVGRSALERWLNEPIQHMRDVQSTFVLKLTFGRRVGLDPMPLLRAQRATVAATIEALSRRLERDDGAIEPLDIRVQYQTSMAVLALIDELCNAAARRTAGRRKAPPSTVHRSVLSDFSGVPIDGYRNGATVVVHFDDIHKPVVAVNARIDDPVVRDVLDTAAAARKSA